MASEAKIEVLRLTPRGHSIWEEDMMHMWRIGNRTFNLDQLSAIEEFETKELRPDYQQQYNAFGQPLSPAESDHVDKFTIRISFAGYDRAVMLQDDEARGFMAYVAKTFTVEG